MLKKILKNNNIEDNRIRNKYGLIAGVYGIVSNLLLGIIKFIIGILSSSVSIMADAINNISDTLTSILTIVGFKLSSKKPNKKHPYGYARYEYITGYTISIFIIIVGIVFLKESIIKVITPTSINISNITFIILIISIIIKITQIIVYLKFSRIIQSDTLKTNALDSRNDVITTSTILISMIIMKLFHINIDGYLGIIVSIFIIISNINMLLKVLEPIIGIRPTKKRVNYITKKLLSYNYIKGMHGLVIHNYGVHNDFVTVHLEVDSKMNLLEAHDLMDVIENDFKEKLGIDLTIHMDPVIIGDSNLDKIKIEIETKLKKLDKDLKIHDFRITNNKTYTKVLFDCVVPYEKEYTEEFLSNYLKKELKNKKYNFIIEIDRPFC